MYTGTNMKTWRTQFERVNFDFDPPLYQRADVVFQTDVPYDDDHLGDFEAVAWEAMWTQNPHWSDKDLMKPLEGYAGWSSVMGGRKFEEVKDIDIELDLGEPGIGLPRIGETFTRRGENNNGYAWDRSYRVTGFYKTYTSTRKSGNDILDEIVDEIIKEEEDKMTPEQRERKNKRMKVISCAREEAEFVSGSGVGGCIARIEDVIITGLVNWEPRTIARHRRDYKIHDDLPTEIYKYWEE